jgi:hypothetical protein
MGIVPVLGRDENKTFKCKLQNLNQTIWKYSLVDLIAVLATLANKIIQCTTEDVVIGE